MSILSSSGSGSGPLFHEFKKQASFFFKEKIKTARLALTDVTPAQLLAEEATNGSPEGPDAPTLKMISKAAFEVDDYCRIVDILHKRLVRFERKNWRECYKALIVLENLLTHGPERVAEEFQGDTDVITQMANFQHVDDKGFNWGLNVRKKSERILKLLEKGPLLKQERDKARRVSRGIQGFGSFCIRPSSHQQSSLNRCNSDLPHHNNQQHLSPISNSTSHIDSKERERGVLNEESWNCKGEENALLGDHKDKSRIKTTIEDHPFEDSRHLSALSLLSGADELQAY